MPRPRWRVDRSLDFRSSPRNNRHVAKTEPLENAKQALEQRYPAELFQRAGRISEDDDVHVRAKLANAAWRVESQLQPRAIRICPWFRKRPCAVTRSSVTSARMNRACTRCAVSRSRSSPAAFTR